ncbi:MAG: peptidase domain-containing ABC transporter [Gammaproteobacteria bacterium]|nr:peptidase domain-containing ABC transporter [Gammaproteobacteria bacterium]MBU2059106.1 peptidase domain-containing ABC transporter [Gammaproteobacteria bacterium]MBU2173657.1 peptidase domain-containing ABC transporter [Gammaproteobacteria bacterium]MBU2246813.1 peptidase domain-containing ABC transporter [Gammaproteobacteria bacterium]MBU2343805.1 peptidase domain-containing ABC transporter [Gammaproteobacteria bacterium]
MQTIYQSEAAECGLACLAMVAGAYGYKTDMASLRQRYPLSLKGLTLQHLMQLADNLGLAGRALRLEPEELAQLKLPCILHWQMSHFVVLVKVKGQKIQIHDPAFGKRELGFADVDQCFTGIALELSPTTEFKKQDQRQKLSVRQFWSSASGLWSALFRILLMSLVLQFFLLVAPYYMQLVVDEVLVSRDLDLLHVLAIGFALLLLLQILTNILRSWLVLHLGSVLNLQLATNLFRHLLHLPMSFFEKRHMGDIVSRFGSLQQLRDLLTNSLIEALIDGLMACTVLVLLFVYHPVLAAVVLAAVLLYALLRYIFYSPLKQCTEQGIVAQAKEQSGFMESVRAIQCLQLFSKQSQRLSLWQNQYSDAVDQQFRLGRWHLSLQAVHQLLFGIEHIVVIYLAALAVIDNAFSVGMLFAFASYKSQFTQRAAAFIDHWIEFRMLELHLQRLADIALTDTENLGERQTYLQLQGHIELRDLHFQQTAQDPWLFHQLSFRLSPGESVAIVGPSGCGKTSLLKIVLGLATAQQGKVLIDGMELSSFGLQHYRSQIAAVMQNDQLLSGSVMDNISFFSPKPDVQHLMHCAELAAIHQDIIAMPMGYNTLIGDMGSALSGGQKQRLLIARALYHKPRVLLLDEATSHLDLALEVRVNQAIRQLQIARIIVAHRPDSILTADRILLLQQGQLTDISCEFRQLHRSAKPLQYGQEL